MTAPARTFASRSGAVRAARAECRRHLGDAFCAYEGPDYEIHPDGAASMWDDDRFYFRLRGPALAISEGATPEEAGVI
jgi:hypothetical protein